jgi:hypothetical protein
VAYLARATDKTTVSTLLGIAWRSVGAVVERVVQRHLDSKRLDGLVFIGIDEFSYRKRHHNGWSGCLTGKNSTQGGDR